MARLVWTENARKDLRIIVDYISKRAPQAGRKTGFAIRQSVDILRYQPLLGSPIEETEEFNLREMYEGNFRIVYSYESSQVNIIKVIRAERDFQSQFTDESNE